MEIKLNKIIQKSDPIQKFGDDSLVKEKLSNDLNYKITWLDSHKKLPLESKKTSEYAVVFLLDGHESPKTEAKSIYIHQFSRLKPMKEENAYFRLVSKNIYLYKRYVEMQSKIVESEVKSTREKLFQEKHWNALKKAFYERLDEIHLKMKGI